jgi:hypothetical protein
VGAIIDRDGGQPCDNGPVFVTVAVALQGCLATGLHLDALHLETGLLIKDVE